MVAESWVELVGDTLPAERIREFVSGDARLGGIVSFSGVTRADDDPAHGKLIRLEYEAHPSMALGQMRRLAETAASRWEVGRMALVHRLGAVLPGEASVIIAVACAHRAEAFDACRWLIDKLKQDVPIWKKDVFEDGFVRWVDPSQPGISTPLHSRSEA